MLGTGLGTNLDVLSSAAWLAAVLAALEVRDTRLTLTGAEGRNVLLVTPPRGKSKDKSRGAAFTFQHEMGRRAAAANVDHLATWSLAEKGGLQDDGVHFDLGNNVLLATMVVNWLDMIEID